MISFGEEVVRLDKQIREFHPGNTEDIPTLKRILREALEALEKELATIRPQSRTAVLTLYLDRIRKVAFDFHLATIKLKTRNVFLSQSITRENMNAVLARYGEDLQRVAMLYRYL